MPSATPPLPVTHKSLVDRFSQALMVLGHVTVAGILAGTCYHDINADTAARDAMPARVAPLVALGVSASEAEAQLTGGLYRPSVPEAIAFVHTRDRLLARLDSVVAATPSDTASVRARADLRAVNLDANGASVAARRP
jgi:hypothetical protein